MIHKRFRRDESQVHSEKNATAIARGPTELTGTECERAKEDGTVPEPDFLVNCGLE